MSTQLHPQVEQTKSTGPLLEAVPQADDAPLTPRKSRRIPILIAAIAASILLITTGILAVRAYHYESTDDAQIEGNVRPLSARIAGHVLEVHAVRGQLVHAGDVLVTIDPGDFQIAVDQAKANLADAKATAASTTLAVPVTSASAWSGLDSARAAVASAQAGVSAAQQDVEAAKAILAQSEADAARTDADLTRYAQLVEKQDVSRQQYDQAAAAAKANRAAVIAERATVANREQGLRQAQERLLQMKADLANAATAPQQVSVARAKAASAEAQVEQRQAQLDQAELNLSYTIIRAPVTGIIGQRSVEPGQNVSVGQELVDLVPLDDLWVTANFKETQLAHMRPGDPATIRVDAYGRTWTGRVTNLGGGTGSVFSLLPPENATGNYVKVVQRVPVRIDFGRTAGVPINADALLKPGLSVEPEVKVR